MRNCVKALTISAVLLLGGCAKEYTRNDKDYIEKVFDSWIEYYYGEDGHVSGQQETSTSDVLLQVEGHDLAAYIVDSAWGILAKIVYPQL